MSTYRPKPSDYQQLEIRGKSVKILAANTYNSFDISLLGLGDVSQPSTSADAIAAIFDLQGFTAFCRQIEPHLSVPLFLSNFLEWLLDEIKREMTKQRFETGATLWCPLPFFLKFMGDGLLVLWDSSGMADSGRRNVIVSAYEICEKYKTEFLPFIAKQVVGPPPVLRCGLARGAVYSVGSDSDFVGSSINMASRIQKLAGTTFAFNRRGFNLEDPDTASFFTHDVIIRKAAVRGIGADELIAILKSEYDAMSEEDRKQFCEP